jgi:hypothetical protein
VDIEGVPAWHRRILALDQRQQSSQSEQVEQVPLAIRAMLSASASSAPAMVAST